MKFQLFVIVYSSLVPFMKPVYFPIIFTAVTHPSQWTVIKLLLKQEFIREHRFDKFIKCLTLATACILLLALILKSAICLEVSFKKTSPSTLDPFWFECNLLQFRWFLFAYFLKIYQVQFFSLHISVRCAFTLHPFSCIFEIKTLASRESPFNAVA